MIYLLDTVILKVCRFPIVGMDSHSWGLSYKGYLWHNGEKKRFCEPFYEQDTVIGFHLNLYLGTLSIYKNRQSLGVAVTGLHHVNAQLYPAASSTSIETEVELGLRTSQYLSLQEKCCVTIARSLKRKIDVTELPLPCAMKRHLNSIT